MTLKQLNTSDWLDGFNASDFKIYINFNTSTLITWCQRFAETTFQNDYKDYFDMLRQNFDEDTIKKLLSDYFHVEVVSMTKSTTIITANLMVDQNYISRDTLEQMMIDTLNLQTNEIQLIFDGDENELSIIS